MDKEFLIRWKPGYRKASLCDAKRADEALKDIRRERGEVTRETVLDTVEADESHIMRPLFEWDDTEAARQHRLTQAGEIIRSIEITYIEENITTRQYQFENVPTPIGKKRVYKPVEEILQDPAARAELLKRAINDLLAVRRKYVHLQELAIVIRSIDEFLETPGLG